MKNHKQAKNLIQDEEDSVKDSLIEDYQKYSDYLERQEWTRERITATELLSSIITISKLKARNDGMVLDIKCPAGLIIGIPGIEDLTNGYEIEKIRPLEIKFADSNRKEIAPDTRIKIFKHKLLKKDVQIGEVLYRDISMADYSDSPNLFKDYKDLYRFRNGIEIKGEDSLRLYIVNPDIDVDIIKFSLGIDLWTRFSET
jgi:translation initiation factor IF-2